MSIEAAIADALQLSDLRPNAQTNLVLTNLVESIVLNQDASRIKQFKKHTINKIRKISSNSETEMEIYWSKKISESKSPHDEMKKFPYIDNYIELTQRELELVRLSGLSLNQKSQVLVIGSGPLPLSAIELNHQTDAKISQVDNSGPAINLSQKLCESIGMKTKYYLNSGQDVKLKKDYDLILIAALAGDSTKAKQKILDNVLPNLSQNGRIILRSAIGMRELLYPGIKADRLKHVKKLVEYHPQDYVINSVYIYGGKDE